MNITESIILAFDSIRANKLRASLTLLGIAIGVFALVGSSTLVKSLNQTVANTTANLGENTFAITRFPDIMMGGHSKYRKRKPITYSQYKEFRKKFTESDFISCESRSNLHTIKSGNLSTDPDVMLIGCDENYFFNNNILVDDGRVFTAQDLLLNRNLAIIGNDIVTKIFPEGNPLGKTIRIKNQNFEVIGVLKVKGSILNTSLDNQVIIPINIFLKYFASEFEESLTIHIKAFNSQVLQKTIDQAIGTMRAVRNLKPWEENSFEVKTNESISSQFSNFTQYLTYFGFFSAIIALIAAGIGITNIMLVSIKERTREIGVRKAVGAKNSWIVLQFLIETITLCQIGGIIGILIGFTGAWLMSSAIGIKIYFSIEQIITGIIVCTILGIISGIYPAWKAANLNPIDALRYE